MKWHSLLKDPTDLPQRINEYEESEDVMVIERCAFVHEQQVEYIVNGSIFYYGHWEPNGEEGWRARSTDYSDCGKFGGFPVDTHYREIQEGSMIHDYELSDYSKKEQEFIKNNCTYIPEFEGYVTREIVGWAYFPNEKEFIEENKDLLCN